MKDRMKVALIGLTAVGTFAALVGYGWTHRYGAPPTYEVQEPPVLAVPFQATALPLDPGDAAWRNLPALEVRLMPQMSQQPWTTGLTPAVRVQALHDGSDIYFRLVWQDDVPNQTLSVDSFTDGCAVALPLETAAPVRSIMMGFSSPVNIWHWQAHKGPAVQPDPQVLSAAPSDYAYPFEDRETLPVSKTPAQGAVRDLLAQRPGSLTPKVRQRVQGQGHWDHGTWAVVLKRALHTPDAEQDSQFPWGRCRASFAVWDGDQGDRGARKSMSDWVILDIQAAQEKPETAGGGNPKSEIRNPKQTRMFKTEEDPKRDQPVGLASVLAAVVPAGTRPPHGPKPILRVPGFLAAVAVPRLASVPPAEPEPKVIEVVAQRFHYTPSRISVRKGERLTLRLESLDVTHGLYLDGYGVDIKARPGVAGKVTFRADKPGRFTFRCSETCGEFHPYMVGFFEVTPNRRFHMFAAALGIAFVVVLGARLRGPRPEKGTGGNVGTD